MQRIERSHPCPRIHHKTQSHQKVQLHCQTDGDARRQPGLEASGSARLTRKIATQLGVTISHIPKAPIRGVQVVRIGHTSLT